MCLTFKIFDNDDNIDFIMIQQASKHFEVYTQQTPNAVIVNNFTYDKLKNRSFPLDILIDLNILNDEANLCFRR